MQKAITTTLIFLAMSIMGLTSAQANESIHPCLNHEAEAKNIILTEYDDSEAWNDPNPSRPLKVYQIGEMIDRDESTGAHDGYESRVVVLFKSGQCKWQRIIGYYGYEPYVPFNIAVEMELKEIDWNSRNFVSDDLGTPSEEDVDLAAEIGHGCEPWTQAMAQARRKKGLSLDGCPVRKQRLKPFWQTQ